MQSVKFIPENGREHLNKVDEAQFKVSGEHFKMDNDHLQVDNQFVLVTPRLCLF